jgi:hypothetical protein
MVKPVRCTLVNLYSACTCCPLINQCCRNSCCACFHSGDPGQVVPFVLYTVLLYTHSHTHTSAAISATRSLFRPRKWFCFKILQYTLHRLQLSQHFSLAISFRNQQFLSKFILSVGSKQRDTTMLDFEHVTHYSYFFRYKSQNRFQVGNAGKLPAMKVNGLSAISSL